jgi:hypothetical protein
LGKVTPVTDAVLANQPDGDWLTWRHTSDDMGPSPLKEIDGANASRLRVAWTWSLPPGASESTPRAHDGVLFVFDYRDRVWYRCVAPTGYERRRLSALAILQQNQLQHLTARS